MQDFGERRSTAGLIGTALSQTSSLIASEMRLARLEVRENVVSALSAAVSIVGAAVFLIVALIFLLQALVAWLTERGWAASSSNLVVGLAVAALASASVWLALRRLRHFQLVPIRAIDQAKTSVAVFKDKVVP